MLLPIAKGIYGALTGGTLVTSYVGTRIYNLLAPSTAALPYVVFQVTGGGEINQTPRDELDVEVDVKAIAASALEAQQIADAIRSTLHEADLVLEASWQTFRCEHTTPFVYAENTEQRQYFHAGGCYRIRAVKE